MPRETRSMHYSKGLRSAAIAAILLTTTTGRAEESEVARGSDPSEIVSRLEVRNEYIDLDTHGYINTTVLRGDWAPNQYWQMRLDLPLTGSDSEGPGSSYGFGDIYLTARGKYQPLERWSLIGELGFKLDTASDDALGTGKNQIAPFTALVWKPAAAWILAPMTYQYFGSISGDDDREDISESNFAPQALYHLPRGFWLLLDAEIYVDHEQNDDPSFYPEGEFGWVANEHVETWIRAGGNVSGEATHEHSGWKGEFGIRYLFE